MLIPNAWPFARTLRFARVSHIVVSITKPDKLQTLKGENWAHDLMGTPIFRCLL